MTSSNNRTSDILVSQLPWFVRNDHPQFVQFLEAYYEWMEQSGQTMDTFEKLADSRDIDQSLSQFQSHLYKMFLKLFPSKLVGDRNLLLKNVLSFYKARGTEKSVKLILSLITGGEIPEFYYPKKDILKVSDGKWYVKKTLKIADFAVDNVANTYLSVLDNFAHTRIIGRKSGASATVETVESFYQNGILVSELEITNPRKNFQFNDQIYTRYTNSVTNVTHFLSANIYSGIISGLTINNPGTLYTSGTIVPVESNSGSGAIIQIGEVTQGGLNLIYASSSITGPGAGFRAGDSILITGGGGVGAAAHVSLVDLSGTVHPNSYNLISSTIGLEANTQIGNTIYSNLNSSITDPCNNWIQNSMSFWIYGNTGPFLSASISQKGALYTSSPTMQVQANTEIKSLGILGRMVINNPGINYAIGDRIEFVNAPWATGDGAMANVTNVNSSGSIISVYWKQVPGFPLGGMGYDNSNLPRAVIYSANGTNGSILAATILGEGETLLAKTDTIGEIASMVLSLGGSGYTTPPYINLTAFGDGTANVTANILTGIYYYDGRYLNDDGFISGYNFLEDGHYYQNYSYVIRIAESLETYRKALLNLTHPAGMLLFGEYLYSNAPNTVIATSPHTYIQTVKVEPYSSNGNNVTISYTSHGLLAGNTVSLEFLTGNLVYFANGIYTVANVPDFNTFMINTSIANTTSGNVTVYLPQ